MTYVEMMVASRNHVKESKKLIGDLCQLIRTAKKNNPGCVEIQASLAGIDQIEKSRSNALRWIEYLKKKGIE